MLDYGATVLTVLLYLRLCKVCFWDFDFSSPDFKKSELLNKQG